MTKKFKRKYDLGGVVDPKLNSQGIKPISSLDTPINIDPNSLHYLDAQQQSIIHQQDKKRQGRWRNPLEGIKSTLETDNNFTQAFQVGLYGADALLNFHDKQLNDQNYARRLRNIFTQKPLYDYNNLRGPDSNGGAEHQDIVKVKNGGEIRKATGQGNVHLDNGEFVQLPDLSTEHVQGGPQGTDTVQTGLPQGARVFSDTLKPKGEKRTYAQLAKKYDTAKYKKVLDNPYSNDIDQNTAKLMFTRHQGALEELFKDQQAQNGNSDGTEFKNGGVYGKDGLKYGEVGTLPYEEWKKTQSPVIKDSVLKKMYHDYLKTPQYPKSEAPAEKPWYEDLPDDSNPINVPNPGPFPSEPNNILGNSGKTSQSKTDAAKDIYDLFSGDTDLKKAFFESYKKQFPDSKATPEQVLKNFYDVEKHIEQLRSKATPEELKSIELDKTKDNSAYNKLAKKYGLAPIERNNIGRFQGAYRTLAELKSNPEYKDVLADFDLNPVGVDDQKYGKSNYENAPISPADFIMGNTTLGQLARYSEAYKPKEPISDGKVDDTKTPTQTPGYNFESVLPWEQTMSTMGKFPLYQAAPEALGYLSAISPYSYYTPDYTTNEVAPPTLNIQPQVNSINSSFQSGIRQNTGNASVNNSRNTAMFNQALEAKQQAFGNKQNFDANARFQADQYNAEQRTKENQLDLNSAATVHNEYRAAALDNASTERLNAAFSLTDKLGKYHQDEYKKMLYFDTVIPDFYYTGDASAPIKQDPNSKQKFYSKFPKP